MNHGFLKQSTASQARLVGPFLDDTDFKTAETGLTIANTDVKLSPNGAAGANKNSGGGTHRNNGMYSLTFDATDTATVGELAGSIVVSGALPVVFKFVVLEEAIYAALFEASAAGFDANQRVKADVERWLTGTPDALSSGKVPADLKLWLTAAPNALVSSRVDASVGAMAANVLTASSINADAITAAKVAADVSAEIADSVWDEAIVGHVGSGSTGEALSNAGAAGSPPSAATIADAVWDEDVTTHTSASTTGQRLGRLPNVAAGGNGGVVLADAAGRAKVDVERWLTGTPNALQSGRVDSYVGAVAAGVIAAASFATNALDAVWSTATRLLTAGTNIVLAKGTGVTGFNDPAVGAIADQVWDEALSGHLGAGSTGEALDAAASGSVAGPGALSKTIRILIAAAPVQGASVWVSTDAGGTNVIAGPLITDSFGIVTVLVDVGTYYVWARKDGIAAILGDAIAVS